MHVNYVDAHQYAPNGVRLYGMWLLFIETRVPAVPGASRLKAGESQPKEESNPEFNSGALSPAGHRDGTR